MRRFLLAGTALLALAGSALADDPYASLYGNTVVVTGTDGSKLMTYVNQDMTWEQHWANGMMTKGTYSWKDPSTACFTQTDPTPKSSDPGMICYANQTAHSVGDSWMIAGPDGKPIPVSLTAGR